MGFGRLCIGLLRVLLWYIVDSLFVDMVDKYQYYSK